MENNAQRKCHLGARAAAACEEALGLYRSGQTTESEAALREVICRWPRDATAYLVLGEMLAEQQRLDEAVAVYDRGCRRARPHALLRYNLGCVLLQTGNNYSRCARSADEALEQSVLLDPADAAAWNNLGVAYKREGFLTDAVGAFGESLALLPDSPTARFNLGAALHILGQLEEAEAAYRDALRVAPADAMTHRHLVLLLRQRYAGSETGQAALLREAGAAAREAVRLELDEAEGRRLLAAILAELGDREAALAEYREGMRRELAAGAPQSDLGLARMPAECSLLSRAALSRQATHHRMELSAGGADAAAREPDWQNRIGLACAALGDHTAAINGLRRAIELDPHQAEYRENLGLSLWASGDLPAALAAALAAVRLAPGRAAAHFLYGLLLQASDQPAAAVAAFREALARCPADAQIHAALALALEQRREMEPARAEWEVAMQLDLKLTKN